MSDPAARTHMLMTVMNPAPECHHSARLTRCPITLILALGINDCVIKANNTTGLIVISFRGDGISLNFILLMPIYVKAYSTTDTEAGAVAECKATVCWRIMIMRY